MLTYALTNATRQQANRQKKIGTTKSSAYTDTITHQHSPSPYHSLKSYNR